MGAVFYNDSNYIAHNCTIITHTYRVALAKIDPTLEDAVGMIDFIPRLRSMGEQALMVHVEEQKATLLELVGRMQISTEGNGSSAQVIPKMVPTPLTHSAMSAGVTAGLGPYVPPPSGPVPGGIGTGGLLGTIAGIATGVANVGRELSGAVGGLSLSRSGGVSGGLNSSSGNGSNATVGKSQGSQNDEEGASLGE